MFDSQTLAFIGIAALFTITPGADTMLVIRSVLARGTWAGLLTTAGICCGLFVHASVSALGLSLILVRSATAFEVVKIAGAAYLVALGVQSLWRLRRARAAGSERMSNARVPRKAWRSFAEGFVSNILNPKVAIFYLALLPQFIGLRDSALAKSLLLAGIHFAESMLWFALVCLLVGRMRELLMSPVNQRRLEAVTGAVLIAFGLRLAFEHR